MRCAATLLLAAGVAWGGEAPDDRVFRTTCDGSAAVTLTPNGMVVAYDETNTLFVFDPAGGAPTAERDLTPLLSPSPKGEIDLEGAARAGDRIWWIGSHSRSKDGDDAPSRRMLFATTVPSPTLDDLEVDEGPIDLLDVLLTSDEVAAVLTPDARARPPKEGGISIEGLATTPQNELLVGFRSPLSSKDGMTGTALVVRLTEVRGRLTVAGVHALDLDDRGVRDIVRDDDSYLIVAGAPDAGGESALYRWDGEHAAIETASLGDFNAEAIVATEDGWLLLSDDGKTKREGDTCDKRRKKKPAHPSVFFRGRRLSDADLE